MLWSHSWPSLTSKSSENWRPPPSNMIIRSSVCASVAAQDSAGVWSERTFSNLAVFIRWLPNCKDGGVRACGGPALSLPFFCDLSGAHKGTASGQVLVNEKEPGRGVRANSLVTSWTAGWPPPSTPSSNTPSLPSRE